MSFARSDVRKDNSFRNAKAPLLQKIFHLLSTTAIFCLLSVADVVRRLALGGPVWCLRACLAPVGRFAAWHLRAGLPPASPSLLGVGPLWGHPCGLAPRFGACEPVAPWRGAPRWPSLRARAPFLTREPVTPWRGATRWPSLRARTPFWDREPVAPWCGAPLGPSLRARAPFWGPRARHPLARGPSVAISSGSHPVLRACLPPGACGLVCRPRARRPLA